MIPELRNIPSLKVYESSVSQGEGATYFLARRAEEKVVGCVGKPCLPNAEKLARISGRCVCVGPTDHANAEAIRAALPWTAPARIGLATSIGLGDRLGLATPGHVRAVRTAGRGLEAVLAQQSIREMTRTRRTPQDVMDTATWGVLQEGFTDGFGADADHLQTIEDIDATVPARFTMFTIDPGRHVTDDADDLADADLAARLKALDYGAMETTLDDLRRRYLDVPIALHGGHEVKLDSRTFAVAVVKYAGAIAHTEAMYRHLKQTAAGEFELEVSVDETQSPTSPAEHYFFASELKRLGVEWVSMAPRFVGRFEKGVDYIGDLGAFRACFAAHVAVMRTLGPYKISIHSGSDKFSIYPILAELAGGLVHLKTAGTSYLEALRAIAAARPELFREILDFSRERYETDRATYHVSADASKVPPAATVGDEQLPALLDDFDARQVLHVTFGSVLTEAGGERFAARIREALAAEEEAHYAALEQHLGRHIEPFVR